MHQHAWPRRARGARLGLVCFLGFATAACGGSSSSTAPAPTFTLTGTFSGQAGDSSGPGTLTWKITQSGTSVSGSASFTDAATGASGTGNVSGSLSGSTLSFTISIPAGGFPAPADACTASMQGSAQATSTSIDGTYTGTNSCTGPIQGGHFTLTKQ
jgi:hypothetical protein